jgi:hypothetical protein
MEPFLLQVDVTGGGSTKTNIKMNTNGYGLKNSLYNN